MKYILQREANHKYISTTLCQLCILNCKMLTLNISFNRNSDFFNNKTLLIPVTFLYSPYVAKDDCSLIQNVNACKIHDHIIKLRLKIYMYIYQRVILKSLLILLYIYLEN